jgi:hypothetical protein
MNLYETMENFHVSTFMVLTLRREKLIPIQL